MNCHAHLLNILSGNDKFRKAVAGEIDGQAYDVVNGSDKGTGNHRRIELQIVED